MTDKSQELENLVQDAEQYNQLVENDPIVLIERIYKLWWHWADFSLFIISPTFDVFTQPTIHAPESLPDGSGYEFVYPIYDHGYKLMTSKAEEMFSAGTSMCKLYYTIEKMVSILVERLNSGGISTETEVKIAFGGHELAQRKGFESVINLACNVVVTNFEPGKWGERYLEIVKRLADRGYGYPTETPRDVFRRSFGQTPTIRS